MTSESPSFWVWGIVSLFLNTNTENVHHFLLTSQKFTAAWDRGSGHGCCWLGQAMVTGWGQGAGSMCWFSSSELQPPTLTGADVPGSYEASGSLIGSSPFQRLGGALAISSYVTWFLKSCGSKIKIILTSRNKL